MNCPKCGSENPDDARFCAGCGAALDGADDARRPVSWDRSDQMCFGPSGGTLPALVIGAIIIIVGVTSVFGRDFGEMMGAWGESFGEGMGEWGIGVGRFFAEWGTGWGSNIGAYISIVIGLAIVYYVMYGRGRR
ncbi:zinc ribbon domain-containing protein [Candidatus Bathyarchaeota archaeon]|nr:zinc ribbon domain-containing protein [Candidatus Bathyarchaeota archaeon]MBL7080465.1 zinc ribbon domain-containing protein [Candidatus Bathyarchaeota archaeon]